MTTFEEYIWNKYGKYFVKTHDTVVEPYSNKKLTKELKEWFKRNNITEYKLVYYQKDDYAEFAFTDKDDAFKFKMCWAKI